MDESVVKILHAAFNSGGPTVRFLVRLIAFSVDGSIWFTVPLGLAAKMVISDGDTFVASARGKCTRQCLGSSLLHFLCATECVWSFLCCDRLSMYAISRTWPGHVWLACVACLLVEFVLKLLIGRARPSVNTKTRFFPGEANSCPSGHTQRAFLLARFFAGQPASLVGPAYAWWLLASAVGLSRVMMGRHYLTDVLLGAAVGACIYPAIQSVIDPDGTIAL